MWLHGVLMMHSNIVNQHILSCLVQLVTLRSQLQLSSTTQQQQMFDLGMGYRLSSCWTYKSFPDSLFTFGLGQAAFAGRFVLCSDR